MLRGLLAESDIFSQGYRPTSIAALGFSPEEAAKINPGIVYVSLSAYGHAGPSTSPWAARRGFNSLVQTATGFNHAEGQAAGVDGPKELPAQMLDHATGYMMAFGAMMAKARQSREGGSWHVRVSLAQTGHWLWNLGRVADGFKTEDLKGKSVSPFIEEIPSGFGPLRSVPPFGDAVENPGLVVAPGDAARQSPAAMAGAFPASLEPLFFKTLGLIAFFDCLRRQLGTISTAMRQIAADHTTCSSQGPMPTEFIKRIQLLNRQHLAVGATLADACRLCRLLVRARQQGNAWRIPSSRAKPARVCNATP